MRTWSGWRRTSPYLWLTCKYPGSRFGGFSEASDDAVTESKTVTFFSPQSSSCHAGWGRGKTLFQVSVPFKLLCTHLHFFSRKSWKPRWRGLKWSRPEDIGMSPNHFLLRHWFWGIHGQKASARKTAFFVCVFCSVSLADRWSTAMIQVKGRLSGFLWAMRMKAISWLWTSSDAADRREAHVSNPNQRNH